MNDKRILASIRLALSLGVILASVAALLVPQPLRTVFVSIALTLLAIRLSIRLLEVS